MNPRGRRPPRISGDSRQDAILSAAEELLAVRSFDEISIEELARGAGISRSNFYFYFSSKDQVLLALLDRVITEVDSRVGALPRAFETDPAAAWRSAIGVFVDVFRSHGAVTSAVIAARARSAEVLDLWTESMQSWVDYSTDVIRAERARGAAPTGIDARDLAIALNLMNERVLSASFSAETLSIDADSALDALASIWTRSIYGSDLDQSANDSRS